MDLSLREAISLFFVFIGTAFSLIAALGVLRMPDLFLRMSASTKASTLGVGSLLLACVIYFSPDDTAAADRALATILFLLLTAPISAHMIARAGYLNKDVHLWQGTRLDDLKGHYDLQHNILMGNIDSLKAPTDND